MQLEATLLQDLDAEAEAIVHRVVGLEPDRAVRPEHCFNTQLTRALGHGST
jgi:hypothetical protein